MVSLVRPGASGLRAPGGSITPPFPVEPVAQIPGSAGSFQPFPRGWVTPGGGACSGGLAGGGQFIGSPMLTASPEGSHLNAFSRGVIQSPMSNSGGIFFPATAPAIGFAGVAPQIRTAPSVALINGSTPRGTSPSPARLQIPAVTTSAAPGINGLASPQVPVWQVQVPVQQIARPAVLTIPPVRTVHAPTSIISARGERVAVPQGLLARIDGVVSEMERELSEDLMHCVGSPLRTVKSRGLDIAGPPAISGCGASNAGDNENTIDWLDKQIFAIEQRREACEMRQSHLAELRRIVAEGNSWGGDKRPFSDGNQSTVMGGSDDGDEADDDEPRMSMLEVENDQLRKKVEYLERENRDLMFSKSDLETRCAEELAQLKYAAEAAAAAERRAQSSDEAVDYHARQAANDASHFQARIAEAEAIAERERQACAEAREDHQRAEANLQTLEENSRAVLLDCRALQAKVRELEVERATLQDVQAGFDDERKMLSERVRMLEDQRSELEVKRQSLKDENMNLNKQFSAQLCTKDEQAFLDLAALRERERQLVEEVAEHQAALSASERARRMDNEAQEMHISEVRNSVAFSEHSARNADRLRLAELEQELRDARCAATALEVSIQKFGSDRIKLAEMEQELAQAITIQETQGRQLHQCRATIKELEQHVSDNQLSEDGHARQMHNMKASIIELEKQLQDERDNGRMRIQELEHLLASSRDARDKDQRQQAGLGEEIERLERQLHDAVNSKEHHFRESSTLQGKSSELEIELSRLALTNEEHGKTHAALLKRVSELETELTESISAKDRYTSGLKSRIAELEDQHADLTRDKESMARSQSTLKARAGELESQLMDVQQTLDASKRQHSEVSRRSRELEVQLGDAEQDKENAERNLSMLKKKVSEQQRQLEDLQGERAMDKDNADRTAKKKLQELQTEHEVLQTEHAAHKGHLAGAKNRMTSAEAKALELEQAMDDVKDNHKKQVMNWQNRLAESEGGIQQANVERDQHIKRLRHFEEQLSLTAGDKDDLASKHQQLHSRSLDMEAQLTKVHAEKDLHRNNHDVLEQRMTEMLSGHGKALGDKDQRIAEMEQLLQMARESQSGLGSLEDRCRSLEAELGKEKQTTGQLAAEIERVRKVAEQVEHDATDALEKADEVKRKAEQSYQQKLAIAERNVNDEKERAQELEAQLQGREPRSSPRASIIGRDSLSSISEGARPSLSKIGTQDFPTGRHMSLQHTPRMLPPTQFMPSSDSPFVARVREQRQITMDEVKKAGDVHFQVIQAQIRLAEGRSGRDLRDALANYDGKEEIEHLRRVQERTMNACLKDLQALQSELTTQHQFHDNEREEINNILEMDLQLCQDELDLLRNPSPLTDLPHEHLESLIDFDKSGVASSRDWPEGFSPMHWAAQKGRRDIIDYLLRLDGGREMVHARDKYGRTPLYYAQKAQKKTLEYFLRQEANAGAVNPLQLQERRPAALDDLPDPYKPVLEQISTQGWHSVNWKGGYSMLHWAATKGKRDVCEYLLRLDADPSARDDKGHTAADCAEKNNHYDVKALFEDHASRDGGNMTRRLSQRTSIQGRLSSTIQPVSASSRRPSASPGRESFVSEASSRGPKGGIPDSYVKVMEQIDKIGWDKMQWARGFTLLHWAAKHDRADLVARFMAQGGDPYQQDGNGRTAIDYAQDKNCQSALDQLARPPPEDVPSLVEFLRTVTVTSDQSRKSVAALNPRMSLLRS